MLPIALQTGVVEVSQLRSVINGLIQDINDASPGLLNGQSGSVGNGADSTDDTLFSWVIAANQFATLFPTANSGIRVTAWGTTAGNGQNKTAKIFFGSLTAISTGVVTINAKGWMLRAIILRSGVSTQKALGEGISDATQLSESVQDHTQDETAAITVKVTGASPTSSSANDVLGKGFIVEALR